MEIETLSRQEIIEKFRIHERDTSSPEVQIALLTKRIKQITEHLKIHRKDYSTQRGLVKLVSRRDKLLKYLSKKDYKRYRKILEELGLKK